MRLDFVVVSLVSRIYFWDWLKVAEYWKSAFWAAYRRQKEAFMAASGRAATCAAQQPSALVFQIRPYKQRVERRERHVQVVLSYSVAGGSSESRGSNRRVEVDSARSSVYEAP
jgi:hypothetical protein